MKDGWEIRKLGDLTTALNGLWVGKKPPFVNIAVIRNTNFTKDCQLDTTDIAYIDAEVKHFSTRKLQCGDIIIEKSGGSDKQPVGRPVLFNIPEGDFSFSNFTSTLRINDQSEMLPSFLHKALWAIYRSGKTASLQSKTTGIRNLDFKSYLKLPIPVPPIAEQENIVAELDCLTGIIEKKKKQLEELDKLAQSIFYDMFGDPIVNEKGWETSNIGSLCTDVRYGTSRPACDGGKYAYLRMGNLTYEGSIDLTDTKRIDIPDNEIEKCIVRKGDVLFNRTNSLDLVGKTCLFDLDEEMVIAGYIIRVRLNRLVLPVYLVRTLNTSRYKKVFRALAKGAVNQANINAKEFQSVVIPVPPLNLQEHFAKKIEAIEKEKELVKQSIVETETLFNSRMDYWFN